MEGFMYALNWPRRFIRRLYAWVVSWSETKHAERALGAIAFAESSFFPIPPDPLLIAMTTARPKKYLRFAVICAVLSVAGGAFGYLIGWGLYETLGKPIIAAYGLEVEFNAIGRRYAEGAFLVIFAAAFTPIPYKVITIAAGVFRVNFVVFVAASALGRTSRFLGVALLAHWLGSRYQKQIEKYIDVLSILFVGLLIAGFLLVRYL